MADAPEWAMREFCKRANLNYDVILTSPKDLGPALRGAVRSGGELIAAHEEEPVDPVLIEARTIAASRWSDENMSAWAEGILAGACDDHIDVRQACIALRRGIELGKAGEA